MSAFLILHGLENRRWPGHWQRHLATELRKAGHTVVYPQFPNEAAPLQAEWTDVLNTEFELLAESGVESVTVIGHSLNGLNILAYLSGHEPEVRIERLLVVAPADPESVAPYCDFVLDPSDQSVKTGIARSVDSFTLIASESDEWLPRGIVETYARPLGVEPVIFEGAGHIAMGDGFGRWAGVIDWCLDAGASLTRR